MSTRRTYRCSIEWTHRKWGPQMEKTIGEGSSIRRAISNALLSFFAEKSQRERRRDAHVELRVHAKRVNREVAR